MKARDLRAKNHEELAKELDELSREAFSLRMQQGTGQLARPSQFKAVRRDIARVLTIINEKRQTK